MFQGGLFGYDGIREDSGKGEPAHPPQKIRKILEYEYAGRILLTGGRSRHF